MKDSTQGDGVRIIKKYQNRRLYDTEESIYITLQDVKDLVLNGVEFLVQDASSGDDLTRQVLLGILLEEEAGGVPFFSNKLLRQIISFYGHTFQSALGRFLEGNILQFNEAQGQFQEQMSKLIPQSEDKGVALRRMLAVPPANMPNLFGSYLENSKKMFDLMSETFTANPWAQTLQSAEVKAPSTSTPNNKPKKVEEKVLAKKRQETVAKKPKPAVKAASKTPSKTPKIKKSAPSKSPVRR